MLVTLYLATIALFLASAWADGNFTSVCSSWYSDSTSPESFNAICPDAQNRKTLLSIELSMCLTNADGNIVFTQHDFLQSLTEMGCKNITVSSGASPHDPATMSAKCLDHADSYNKATIDLNTIISVDRTPALSCSSPLHPIDVSPPSGWIHLGCYPDYTGSSGSLFGYWSNSEKNTPQRCIEYCSSQGYSFSGTNSGYDCGCDDNLRRNASSVPSYNCALACSGDSTQLCGGNDYIDVFQFNAESTSTSVSFATPTSSSSSSSSFSASSHTPSPWPTHKSLPSKGALLGGIIGGLSALIITLIAAYILWRRRLAQKKKNIISILESDQGRGMSSVKIYDPQDPTTYPPAEYRFDAVPH